MTRFPTDLCPPGPPCRPHRDCHPVRFVLASSFAVLLAAITFAHVAAAEDGLTPEQAKLKLGAVSYAAKCAACHGAAGEGTKENPSALTGDKSLLELAKVIDDTMPEGEPELVDRAEAEALAAYIYDEFYSPIAQARMRPARVEFSRLTVRQFENSVADLVSTFRGRPNASKERGLKAEFYNLRSFNKDKRVIERVDPAVSYQFGAEKPEGFPTEPDMEKRRKDDIHDDLEFSIRWNGSIIAPDTGDYEFIVESENGVRLYVNSHERTLCDAWVSSGMETRHAGQIHLLGGRRYPLRLEFFRYKQATASIQLKWKRPGHVEEVIPTRYLVPESTAELFVLNTPFPPDDRTVGYERGTSVSQGWQDAVVQASLETSNYVVDQLRRLAGLGDNDPERDQKTHKFCERFVERAFRRKLTPDQVDTYVTKMLADVPMETGVKRVVLLALMSPEFLYREYGYDQFDSYSMASWLSYAVWDSIPDQVLLDAAGKNELQTPDQIRKQIDRMMQDPRTQFKLTLFFRQWLRLDMMPEILKNQEMYAGFDAQLVSDLRDSLDLFLEDVLSSPEADFRRMFQDDDIYLNGRLSHFYGGALPANADFQKVAFEKDVRAGVLTHPLLLSGFAYDQESSPIHRGVFIARSLLGRRLKPPPEAVAPLAPDLHAGLTTRARVLMQTSPNACQTCHYMINDLGFSLEHFDAAGRYRELDKTQPIDAGGGYLDRTGTEVSFVGSQQLSDFLVESPEAREAFTEQLFQYTIKQPIRAFGENELPTLTNEFRTKKYNIRALLKEIVAVSALQVRDMQQQAPATNETPK